MVSAFQIQLSTLSCRVYFCKETVLYISVPTKYLYYRESIKFQCKSAVHIAYIIRIERISELGRMELLIIANVFPSSLILFSLMLEMMRSYETSVLTRATRRHIP
jgi:hypothetical protein